MVIIVNENVKGAAKSVGFTMVANILSLGISAVATLVVPKLFNEVEYGYWQLYIFYASYAGFFHLGIQDGVYLRYGGANYKDLNRKIMHSQLSAVFFLEVCLGLFLFVGSAIAISEPQKQFVVRAFAVCLILYLPNTLLQYILQMTGRIETYATVLIVEKCTYGLLLTLLLFSGARDFRGVVTVDLIGKGVALIYVVFQCREIVFSKGLPFRDMWLEVWQNLRVGINLMVANIASMLILGIMRFSAEQQWEIETFAQISLPINLCNFVLIFIEAVGQVMFPLLRRANQKDLPRIYEAVDLLLLTFLLSCLLLYQPTYSILSLWLPQYAESMRYLIILLPMCVLVGRCSVISNTFFKTVRAEKAMLLINVIVLIVSSIATIVSVYWYKNIELALLGVICAMAFRNILANLFLKRILRVRVLVSICSELLFCTLFIGMTWFLNGWMAMGIYAGAYIAWLLSLRPRLKEASVLFRQKREE